jgi:hypothetical protein
VRPVGFDILFPLKICLFFNLWIEYTTKAGNCQALSEYPSDLVGYCCFLAQP